MNEYQRRQVDWHEREHYRADSPRNPDNSHPAVAWLNGYRLRKLLELLPEPLAGRTVLSICGGDGEEGDFLRRQGARVTVADLSRVGLAAARLRHPDLSVLAGDSEGLPFADGAFDWVVVRDGLHHLEHPMRGLSEMARMARRGFALLEGQDSMAVRLLVRIGLGSDHEPSGNFVYRFRRDELARFFATGPDLAGFRIFTAWLPPGSDLLGHNPPFRRWIYPVINRSWVRWSMSCPPGRFLLKCLFSTCQALAGRWGNSLIAVAWKHCEPGIQYRS